MRRSPNDPYYAFYAKLHILIPLLRFFPSTLHARLPQPHWTLITRYYAFYAKKTAGIWGKIKGEKSPNVSRSVTFPLSSLPTCRRAFHSAGFPPGSKRVVAWNKW
jgi:hypothetical protein